MEWAGECLVLGERNADRSRCPELDRLYSELDQYHLLLAAIGLPPGVVPAREHPASEPG